MTKIKLNNTTCALEFQIQFLNEKRNKVYDWYTAVSITDENWIWNQEHQRVHSFDVQQAGEVHGL